MYETLCVLAHVAQNMIQELPASSFSMYTKYVSCKIKREDVDKECRCHCHDTSHSLLYRTKLT